MHVGSPHARTSPRLGDALLLAFAAVTMGASSAARADDPEVPAAHYPRLPVAGANAASFAPPGWRIEAQASGDVDGDGRPDLVMVLHQEDKANILAHPGGGENPIDTNPRILAVVLGGPSGHGFRLAVENHTLIPRHDDAFVFDAFDPDPSVHALGVARNAFTVDLVFEANAGSWMQRSRSLVFRIINGRCSLIGFDDDTRDRRDGSTVHTSINYITRRWQVETTGNDDAPTRKRAGTLPHAALLSLTEVGDGMDFEPKTPARK